MFQWNLNPTLGKSLSLAIRAISGTHISDRNLRRVKIETLTVDEHGTLRLQAIVEYEQWKDTANIAKPEQSLIWKLWSAQIIVHSVSYFANTLTNDIQVKIENTQNRVDPKALKQSVVNWIGQQREYIKHFLAAKGASQKKGIIMLSNKTNGPIYFQLRWALGNDWTGWSRQKLNGLQDSWHAYVGTHMCKIRLGYISEETFEETVYTLPVHVMPANQAGSCAGGKPYFFEWSNGFLHLHSSAVLKQRQQSVTLP
ncbi:MAG: hypothetical protein AAF614_20400 [Chloroflexota bacterium]